MAGIKWTEEDDSILKGNYKHGCWKVKELLPHRTIASIRSRASLQKILRSTSKGFCKQCGDALHDDNWYCSSKIKHDYICKKCIVQKTKQARKQNPSLRKWFPHNTLHTNGNTYLVRKRHRPADNSCELCGRIKHTVYHHYGEIKHGEPLLGIWVCRYCHPFVELYDRGFSEKYIILREKIFNE